MAESEERLKRRILKNIFLISLAFCLTFTGFQGLVRLQSSLHEHGGLGVISTGVFYLTSVVLGIFFPKLLISRIGHKWSVAVATLGFVVWMLANGYAVWATMMPASVVSGSGNALLWTAQASYFAHLVPDYARLTHNTVDAIMSRFFGIFYAFFQSSSISGSLISSLVLDSAPNTTTHVINDSLLDLCGAQACPYHNITNPNMAQPPASLVWIMLATYIAIALGAFFMVAIFVDEIPEKLKEKEPLSCHNMTSQLLSTIRLCKERDALLLIVINIYNGMEVGFFTAEFSQSYVACSLGMWMVGYVTLPFGIVNSITSVFSARLAKYTGSLPLFISAFLVDVSIQISLMFWMPHPDQAWVLYVVSGLWGYTDGTWQTHIMALFGVVFKHDTGAAFSLRAVSFSMGAFVSFTYSHFLCTSTKLLILTITLIIGMGQYLAVAIPRLSTASHSYNIDTQPKANIQIIDSKDSYLKQGAPVNGGFTH